MRKLIVVMAVAVAACGTDSVSIDAYQEALRDAACGHLVRCGVVADGAACERTNVVVAVAGVPARFTASQRAAIEAGKVRFDGGNAQACIDAIAARSCDVTSESSRVLPDACFAILAGTGGEGAACALDDECTSQVCDVAACDQACCTGACVGDAAPGRAKIGESCEVARCEAAAFCDPPTMMCVALKRSGGFCTSIEQCGFGLDCDATGACATLPGLGESCAGACRDEGTTCSPTTGLCVEAALEGEACAMTSDCSALYVCDATKRCSPGLPLDAVCTLGQRCADPGAFCDAPSGGGTGRCTLPKEDGLPCTRDAGCRSQYCDQLTQLCAPEPVCL